MPQKKATKYIFLTVEAHSRGKSVVILPGQVLGRTPVTPGVLVQDERGSTEIARARRKASPGDVLFTTTLRRRSSDYAAKDIHSLEGHGNILFADVKEEYEAYLQRQNSKQP